MHKTMLLNLRMPSLSILNASNLPGFAVVIVNEKGILYQQGLGYANKRTKQSFELTTMQKLGSTSKTVVGLALVKAIQDGKLTSHPLKRFRSLHFFML